MSKKDKPKKGSAARTPAARTYLWALTGAVAAIGTALIIANGSGGTSNVPTEKPPTRKPPVRESPQQKPPQQKPPQQKPAPEPERKTLLPGDSNENCPTWAAAGECEGNAAFMLAKCSGSCPKPATPSTPPPKPERADADDGGMAEAEEVLRRLDSDLLDAQRSTDALSIDFDPSTRSCSDQREDCPELARANLSACGEAAFMLQRCAATCRVD